MATASRKLSRNLLPFAVSTATTLFGGLWSRWPSSLRWSTGVSSSGIGCNLSYFSSMSNLFNEIRSTTELFADTETVNLQTYLFAQQLALLKELADEGTSELTDIVSPPKFSTWSRFRWSLRKWWARLVQRWTLVVWSLWESIKMHTVDRHKRRKPLMRLGIWTPSNTIGDKILFN